MSILYIDEQGVSLHRTGEQIIVKKDDQVLKKIPLANIDRVIIVGKVAISAATLALLFDKAIPMIFITWYGKFRGWLAPSENKNIKLRVNQFRLYGNEKFRLEFSKRIVSAKLKNQLFVVKRYLKNHPESDFQEDVVRIEKAVKSITNVVTIDSLRGVEGSATARYFSMLGKMVRREFSFEKRTRRPPKDPVNSLLSFGYTLLNGELITATSAVGFDPHLGFYHDINYGRPSLALDILEEYRFISDSLALYLINKGILKREHFMNSPDRGYYLTEEGRKQYFVKYEKLLRNSDSEKEGASKEFRKVFVDQAYKLARSINENCEYVPYDLSSYTGPDNLLMIP